MPFITDEEFESYKDLEESKRTAEFTHKKAIEHEKESSRKFKIATIILGIIALLGVAGTVYFMNFSTPSNMISQKDHKAQVALMEGKIAGLEETIQNLSMNQELEAGDSGGSAGTLTDELVYAVQIGAFEEKDLSMYSENFVNFKEIKSGGFNKYALGNFESLNEAKKFRRELVRLGFRNAFIASYQNGKRIKIEEAW